MNSLCLGANGHCVWSIKVREISHKRRRVEFQDNGGCRSGSSKVGTHSVIYAELASPILARSSSSPSKSPCHRFGRVVLNSFVLSIIFPLSNPASFVLKILENLDARFSWRFDCCVQSSGILSPSNIEIGRRCFHYVNIVLGHVVAITGHIRLKHSMVFERFLRQRSITSGGVVRSKSWTTRRHESEEKQKDC